MRVQQAAATARREQHTVLNRARGETGLRVGIAIALLVIALVVRLSDLSKPGEVVFDEVHFGSFAGLYVNRTFFFDVHPPLGKLLFAAAGYLGGYNGTFKFERIAQLYPPEVPYVAMRAVSAVTGAATVPLVYLTLRGFGISHSGSVLSALLVLFAFAWSHVSSLQTRPFSRAWWFFLTLTGVALALATGVKVVGLFMVGVIGLSTARDLWEHLCNPSVSYYKFVQHFFARVLCLIVVPVLVYALLFYIHISVLTYPGPGSSMMSSRFRHELEEAAGQDINMAADVTQGSLIAVRHEGSGEAFLHSHINKYPDTDRQQITLYSHMDDNNWWRVFPSSKADHPQAVDAATGTRYIGDKQVVRLQHKTTGTFLSIFINTKAHITPNFLEVSSMPQDIHNVTYDGSDLWRVEFVSQSAVNRPERLQALATTFRLVHIPHGCYLYSKRGVNLPKNWGFGQQEVACISPQLSFANSIDTHFSIDSHISPVPAEVPRATYVKQSFFEKLLELHETMIKGNDLFESEHPFRSTPRQWPFLSRGILYWSRNTPEGYRQVYLLGNLLVWRMALLAVPLYALATIILAIVQNREMVVPTRELQSVERAGLFVFGAWFVNWAGFFIFDRQLFLHHYFPALVFSIMLIGIVVDLIVSVVPDLIFRSLGRALRSNNRNIEEKSDGNNRAPEADPSNMEVLVQWLITAVIVFLVLWAYVQFRPLSVGAPMSRTQCSALKWAGTWDFDCV